MRSFRVPSYAKINLGLFIRGRRNDGFHEIETILQQIDLKDNIEILPTDDDPAIQFNCNQKELSDVESNLCVKAARLLKQEFGVPAGARIKLNKNIPIGAGLGGGSSNAAVILLVLNKLWKLNLSADVLQELASRLGSDVPFFVHGGTMIASGKGETLKSTRLVNKLPILVVYPGISISTAWAYGQLNLNLTKKKKNTKLASFNDINFNDVDFVKTLRNEFEGVIFPQYPIFENIKKELFRNRALFCSLSGSGSALFAIFRNKYDLKIAWRKFNKQFRSFMAYPIKWGYGEVNKAFYSK